MVHDATKTGFFVIPAQAGIQNLSFFLVQESWTPVFFVATNRLAPNG